MKYFHPLIYAVLFLITAVVTPASAGDYDFYEIQQAPKRCPDVECLYTYRAQVGRWVDGDTVDMDVDLGFSIHTYQRFRLIDTEMVIDTPERGEEGFKEATAVSNKTLPPGTWVLIRTSITDKYGRYLVYLPDVNEALFSAELLKDPYRHLQ